MRTFLQLFSVSMAITLWISSAAFADCTRDQAFNKMMALNQLSAKLNGEVPLDPRKDPQAMNRAYERTREFTDMMTPAGPLLAAGKYSEACALYDRVAARFGFDLGAAKSLTMDQLNGDGGKSVSGRCNVTDVAMRTVEMSQKFQAAYSSGKFTYERQREFSKDSEELGRLSSSDPGRACAELDRLTKKYGLD